MTDENLTKSKKKVYSSLGLWSYEQREEYFSRQKSEPERCEIIVIVLKYLIAQMCEEKTEVPWHKKCYSLIWFKKGYSKEKYYVHFKWIWEKWWKSDNFAKIMLFVKL